MKKKKAKSKLKSIAVRKALIKQAEKEGHGPLIKAALKTGKLIII